jgi:diguanylate cyclase (GGDEF)-like protein/PAS domain S-box-containing protein
MIEQVTWGLLFLLALLVLYQQLRMYGLRQQAKHREELFQIVTENAADMIALVDVKGHRLYNSPAYKRILGYSAAELGETSAFDQIHPDDRFKVLEAAREARSTGTGKKLEYRIRHKNGTWRIFESNASTIRNEKGEVAKLVIVNRDITERKRAEELLEHNSVHDALTDLPNRRLFLDRLETLYARSQRHPHRRYAVLFVDVDGFKNMNDRLGHAGGDQLLVEVGKRLAAGLRPDDTIARPETGPRESDAVLSRLGGDEFTLLLDAVADATDALRVAKRIQSAVAEPFFVDGREVRISVSIGIAFSTPPLERAGDLLDDAEVAMRRAKALGGARCELFDEAMHTQAVNRLKLEAELRSATAHRQFRVLYLPVVQLGTQRIISFEALLRWQHPEQGLISPYKFLDAAEDTGLMVPIGRWLFHEACRALREWQTSNSSRDAVKVTLNVSARQFADAGMLCDLQAALRESEVEPSQLQLEITEGVAAADPKLTATLLSHLKHLGIGIVLDDFGTGNCSLRGLRQFPVDALKIDRSLVTEMLADRSAHDIIELVITLAHKMNLKVVAEGIESAKQLEHLRALGCDYGQGYLFSQPVEAKAAELLLRQQSSRPYASGAGAK